MSVAATSIDARAFDLPSGYVERAGVVRCARRRSVTARIASMDRPRAVAPASSSAQRRWRYLTRRSVRSGKVRTVIEKTAGPPHRACRRCAHFDHRRPPGYVAVSPTVNAAGKGGGIALRRQFASLPDSAIEEVSAPHARSWWHDGRPLSAASESRSRDARLVCAGLAHCLSGRPSSIARSGCHHRRHSKAARNCPD